jgi:hypothetical protein
MREKTMTLGTDLTPAQQRRVLGVYVHRYTGDHIPSWSRKPWRGEACYPLQFASDADWLAHTRFPVWASGRIEGACDSYPTWPNHPALRTAFGLEQIV